MAGLARTIELQRAEVAAMSFKTRLIDYLQQFIGDFGPRARVRSPDY